MGGLTDLDVPAALESMAAHLQAKGEWRKGVISPSLVATTCPLARVKIFLGQEPNPDYSGRMNLRAGQPDFGSTVAMTRGFTGEALMLAAMRLAETDGLALDPTYAAKAFAALIAAARRGTNGPLLLLQTSPGPLPNH